MVGESVTENSPVEHIDTLLKAAKKNGIPVFVSPHYYYPTDHGWAFGGTLETAMHEIKMFDRKDPLSLEGFEGSGAERRSARGGDPATELGLPRAGGRMGEPIQHPQEQRTLGTTTGNTADAAARGGAEGPR